MPTDDTRRIVVLDEYEARGGQPRISNRYDAAPPLGELRERISAALWPPGTTNQMAERVLRVLLAESGGAE